MSATEALRNYYHSSFLNFSPDMFRSAMHVEVRYIWPPFTKWCSAAFRTFQMRNFRRSEVDVWKQF